MPDIIDQAFSTRVRVSNWDQLNHWLRANAQQLNGLGSILAASEQARADGVAFPASPEEAKHIIRKYKAREHH